MGLYVKTFVLGTVLFLGGYAIAEATGIAIDSSTLEVFLGLFGAFYAIIIGFIIFITMDNYNRVRDLIGHEVNALQDLRDYLVFVDNNGEVVQQIRSALREYVVEVIESEWPVMCSGRALTADFRDTPRSLLRLMRTVNQIQVSNRSDEVALKLLVETTAHVTTHRTDRLGACGERLPRALRHLVLWISFLAIGVFSLLEVGDPLVKWGLSGINVFSITFIYFIVMDLDNPFRGAWSIDKTEFDDLLSRLE